MFFLSCSIPSDTYKREAIKYEKRPPPIVEWSMIGIVGAIVPSCNPRSTIIGADPVHRLPGVSQTVALKLLRFDLKTVKQLAELGDKDLRLYVLKSEFISKKRLEEFRNSAVQALSHQSRAMMDRRGLPKARLKKSKDGEAGGGRGRATFRSRNQEWEKKSKDGGSRKSGERNDVEQGGIEMKRW